MKIKLLFQGDSITDMGRITGANNGLGVGYPAYAAELIREKYPQAEFEFVNCGISGNKTFDLRGRWETDAIAIKPDIISILIGVNDSWMYLDQEGWMDDAYFEESYRSILEDIKKTGAKILILEQFLLDVEDKRGMRADLDAKKLITRRLAREYADAFIPTDGLFAAACLEHPIEYWAEDGVHPSEEGAKFIARAYLDAVSPLVEAVLNK